MQAVLSTTGRPRAAAPLWAIKAVTPWESWATWCEMLETVQAARSRACAESPSTLEHLPSSAQLRGGGAAPAGRSCRWPPPPSRGGASAAPSRGRRRRPPTGAPPLPRQICTAATSWQGRGYWLAAWVATGLRRALLPTCRKLCAWNHDKHHCDGMLCQEGASTPITHSIPRMHIRTRNL